MPLRHIKNKASIQTNPSEPSEYSPKLTVIEYIKIVIFVSLEIQLENEII